MTVDSQTLTRTNSYSLAGSPLRSVDRQGRVVDTSYDLLGRAVEQRWYNNTTDADADTNRQNTVATGYDVFDRTTGLSDVWSDYTYAYDSLDRLTIETVANPGGPTVVLSTGYTRDDSLRTSLSAVIAGTADFQNLFAYDDRLRMTSVTQTGQTGGNAVAPKHVALSYTDTGRFDTITRYAAADDTDNLVATTAYTYDSQERLTGLSHDQGATTLSNYTWTYDAAGRLIQNTSTDGTVDYSYDARGQLTAADYDYQTDETYQYDTNGNRETANGATYSTGDHNRMTFDGTFSYQYDAEGNRTRRFIWTDTDQDNEVDFGEAATITEYTWNIANQLTTITDRATDGGAATKIVDYTYDVLGRRIGKDIDTNVDGTVDEIARYVYDGSHIALEFDGSTGTDLTHRYLHGPAIDQILADETADDGGAEDVLWPLADHLGSIRDLATFDDATDTTTVANHLVYNAFGRVTSETNTAVDHIFSYTGRERDAESDLLYYRARYYDPDVGKLLSEDPIGFEGGDANLGRYVGNSSVNSTDPDGLFPFVFTKEMAVGAGLSEPPLPEVVRPAPNPNRITVTGHYRGAEGTLAHEIGRTKALRDETYRKMAELAYMAQEDVDEQELYMQVGYIASTYKEYRNALDGAIRSRTIIDQGWFAAMSVGFSRNRAELGKLAHQLEGLPWLSPAEWDLISKRQAWSTKQSLALANRMDALYKGMETTERVTGYITLLGGPAVIVKKGFVVGGRAGLKCVLKGVSAWAATSYAGNLAMGGVASLARKAGVSDTQMRVGFALFNALTMRRAMQQAGKCFVAGTQVEVVPPDELSTVATAAVADTPPDGWLSTPRLLVSAAGILALYGRHRSHAIRKRQQEQFTRSVDYCFGGTSPDDLDEFPDDEPITHDTVFGRKTVLAT